MRTVRVGSSSRCHSVRGRLRPTGPPRGPDVRRRPEIRALRPPRTAVRRLRVDRSADHARRRCRRPARAAPGEPVRPSIRRASCARRTSSAAAVSTKVPPLPAGGRLPGEDPFRARPVCRFRGAGFVDPTDAAAIAFDYDDAQGFGAHGRAPSGGKDARGDVKRGSTARGSPSSRSLTAAYPLSGSRRALVSRIVRSRCLFGHIDRFGQELFPCRCDCAKCFIHANAWTGMADEKDDRAYVSVGIGGRPKLDREVFDPERNPLTGRAVASLPDETGRMRYGLPDNEDRIASCRFGSRRSVFIRSAIRRRANTSRADCRILSICGRGRSSRRSRRTKTMRPLKTAPLPRSEAGRGRGRIRKAPRRFAAVCRRPCVGAHSALPERSGSRQRPKIFPPLS